MALVIFLLFALLFTGCTGLPEVLMKCEMTEEASTAMTTCFKNVTEKEIDEEGVYEAEVADAEKLQKIALCMYMELKVGEAALEALDETSATNLMAKLFMKEEMKTKATEELKMCMEEHEDMKEKEACFTKMMAEGCIAE